MLREAADSLHDELIQAFPPDQDYPLDQLSTAPMPSPVARFLRMRVESQLVSVGCLSASQWYDVRSPVVEATREAWHAALLSTARIPANLWSKSLKQAIQLVLSHLVRPAQTLAGFIFGQDDAPVEVVVFRRLGFFSEYGYLAEGIRGYIEKEQLAHVNRGPLLNLVTRLDRAYTAGYGADDWIRHLDPLYETLSVVTDAVSVDMLRSFFEHKAATEYVQRIKTLQEREQTRHLDATQLYAVLTQTKPTIAERPDPSKQAAPPAPAETEDESTVPLWLQARRESVPLRRGPTATGSSGSEIEASDLEDETVEPAPAASESPPERAATAKDVIDTAGGDAEAGPDTSVSDAALREPEDEVRDAEFDADEKEEDRRRTIAAPTAAPIDTPSEPEPIVPLASEEEEEPPSAASRTPEETPAGTSEPAVPVERPARPEPSREDETPRRLADVVAEALRSVPGTKTKTHAEKLKEKTGSGSVPLWQRFHQSENDADDGPPSEMPIPPRSPIPDHQGASAGREPLDILEKRVFGMADAGRRQWFIDNLFLDDVAAYDHVIRAISKCTTWPDASQVIAENVFKKNNVNIYSEPAVAFTDAVEAYFRKR